jgi:anti-sigma factor RsiW
MTVTSPACPEIGVWRAWLDREITPPRLDAHLEACPGCQRVVADLRAVNTGARDALAELAPGRLPSAVEVAVARERLELRRRLRLEVADATHAQEPIALFVARISTPWRIAASGLAAAIVVSVIVAFTPQGNAAAAAFLAQFRPQQVTAVEVSPQSQTEIVRTLNALGNLGTVQTPNGPRPIAAVKPEQPRTVTLAEASRTVGFSLETPDPATLPAGIDRTPRIEVTNASQVRFTVDTNKARAYYQSTGHPEVQLPDKFDGATLIVSIPAAALLQYGNGSSRDALIVGQAGQLVVDVQGKVSLDEMRDFLLGLPGLPQNVVNQLRSVKVWNQTLPIPVPVDKVNWQSTTFKGNNQGLLLNDNSGVGSAAVWYESGRMYGVAGSLKANDLKRIADSLAVR